MDKNNKQVLLHIYAHCLDIEAFIMRFGNTIEDFKKDRAFYNSMCMSLMQISELSRTLTDDFIEATKDKIQSSIDKLSAEHFAGYRFKFLRIDGDVIKLRKESYDTHDDIAFDPSVDIIDISTLLKDIIHLGIDSLIKVYELCVKEIIPLDTPKITETDLAIVVKALATNVKDWSKERRPIEFDVEKKIDFNHLEGKKRLINDYKLYIGKLNAVYGEFVDNATDYSFIILQNLSDMYSRYLGQYESNALFDKIVDETRVVALNSRSAEDIPVDRLNVCINVIVVDAFIRCRIFEDPEGYSYVDA